MAPLELLAHAASLALEVRERAPGPTVEPEAPRPELVTIQSSAPAKPERKIPESWLQLTPADQELHLRAQRFARVHVAGIRLFSADGVKQGRRVKDLYGVLRKDVDAGRAAFQKTFLAATPTMVDYFHLELVRTLASDDSSLLGNEYPGPLV
jgi:hypothetical protein